MRWPAKVEAGSTCSQLICLTDLIATCSELLGVKLPANAGEDSLNTLPFLRGQAETSGRAVEHHSMNGRFAIRQGHGQLGVCSGSGGSGMPGDAEARKQGLPEAHLFDIGADFAET